MKNSFFLIFPFKNIPEREKNGEWKNEQRSPNPKLRAEEEKETQPDKNELLKEKERKKVVEEEKK